MASHGTRADGSSITDAVIGEMAAEAERGYDVEELLTRRRADPPWGRRPHRSSPCGSILSSSGTCCSGPLRREEASPT